MRSKNDTELPQRRTITTTIMRYLERRRKPFSVNQGGNQGAGTGTGPIQTCTVAVPSGIVACIGSLVNASNTDRLNSQSPGCAASPSRTRTISTNVWPGVQQVGGKSQSWGFHS